MFAKIALMADTAMSIRNIVLGVSIVLGTASAAAAAGPNGSAAELRQCVANMQASGRYFGGGDSDMGITEYDVLVGRCQDQLYRLHGRQAR